MTTEREKPVDPAGTTEPESETMPETARRLLRTQGRAALATVLARDDHAQGASVQRGPAQSTSGRVAWPYSSLVTVAVRLNGSAIVPLLLLSELAEHTRNLRVAPRLSLLFENPDLAEDPLASPRLTLVGLAELSRDPDDTGFFVERHPSAALYARFSDFAVWTVRWKRAHLVAGFGRIRWMTQDEIIGKRADPPELGI